MTHKQVIVTSRNLSEKHMTIIIRMDEENMERAVKEFKRAVHRLNSQIDGGISYEMIRKTITTI